MYLGKVIGTLVATRKNEGLKGIRLLIVQPLGHDLKPRGEPQIAADGTGTAGHGDIVFLVRAREASLALPEKWTPTDLAICGIVDMVELETRGRLKARGPG